MTDKTIMATALVQSYDNTTGRGWGGGQGGVTISQSSFSIVYTTGLCMSVQAMQEFWGMPNTDILVLEWTHTRMHAHVRFVPRCLSAEPAPIPLISCWIKVIFLTCSPSSLHILRSTGHWLDGFQRRLRSLVSVVLSMCGGAELPVNRECVHPGGEGVDIIFAVQSSFRVLVFSVSNT